MKPVHALPQLLAGALLLATLTPMVLAEPTEAPPAEHRNGQSTTAMVRQPGATGPTALGNQAMPAAQSGWQGASRYLTSSMVVLVGVLALAVISLRLLRRFGHWQGGPQGRLELLENLTLGRNERAVLVRVGQRQVLLGVAPGRVSTLLDCGSVTDVAQDHQCDGQLPAGQAEGVTESPTDAPAPSPGFARLLSRAVQRVVAQ